MSDGIAAELTARLRSLAPAEVRVYADGSDTPTRVVGVPHGRKRWSHVVEMIEARPWVRVEFVDQKGRLLGELALERGQDEAPEQGAKVIVPREERLLDLMIKAQQAATKDMAAMLSHVGEVVRIQAEGARAMQDQFLATMQMMQEREAIIRRTLTAPPPADGGDAEPGMMDMIKAAPQVMQMIAMLGAGKPPSSGGGNG